MDINLDDISVLANEMKHINKTLDRTLNEVKNHAEVLHTKADKEEVQDIKEVLLIVNERSNVLQQSIVELNSTIKTLSDRLKKLEMETWKIGLILSSSATGGGALALLGQWILQHL